MLELRILALVGLIVTAIVSSLAAAGIAMLAERIRRARHSTLERRDPPGTAVQRRVGSGQAGWRLRF
jgi:hypothetical protein